MKNILKNIQDSLTTVDGGYSSRKLSALVIIICILAAHVKWISLGDFSQLELVLTIDFSFVSAMLGMTTYQAIKNKANENTNNSDTTK